MKILIIDIDSKIPNYALKKIEKYHIDRGDEIYWNMPIFRNWADKIYVSCVFQKNKHLYREWEDDPKVLIGGSGYIEVTIDDELSTMTFIQACEWARKNKKEQVK